MRNKPIYLIAIVSIMLTVFFEKGNCQNAYYDALSLSKKVTADNEIDYTNSEAISILFNYLPASLQEKFKTLPANIKRDSIVNYYKKQSGNPFISISESVNSPQHFNFVNTSQSLFSSFGNLDVTSIADGVGKFLANRAKQELTVAFFNRFKNILNANPEIGQLFPKTARVLNVILNYNFSNLISTLRAAFESDLKTLPGNIGSIATMNVAKSCVNAGKNIAKCSARLTNIISLLNTDAGKAVSAGLIIAQGAVDKKNPADILTAITTNKILVNDTSETYRNAFVALKLLAIFSDALRSADNSRTWVSAADMANLKDDTLRIFCGLIYEKIKTEKISFFVNHEQKDIATAIKNIATNINIETALANMQSYASKVVQDGETLSNRLKTLKIAGDTTTDEQLMHIGAFADAVKNFLNDALNYSSITGNNLAVNTDGINKVFNYVDTSLSIVEKVIAKDYYGALLNSMLLVESVSSRQNELAANETGQFNKIEDDITKIAAKYSTTVDGASSWRHSESAVIVQIQEKCKLVINNDTLLLESMSDVEFLKRKDLTDSLLIASLSGYYKAYAQSIPDKKGFLERILQYGNFVADVVSAKNSDDVDKAIEAAALPPGSSIIKRESAFNVSVNGYLGFYYGNEHIKGIENKPFFNSYGVTAPIGIAISIGKQRWYPISSLKKFDGHWSNSLFISLFDLGAVAAYRFGDNTTAKVPTIQLKNIFSPGVFFSIGIPKSPVSINFGAQMGPNLRKIDANSTTPSDDSSNKLYLRTSMSVLVDIPFFNLSSKSN